MANETPRRFTARVTGVPRRVGRVLEGAVDSRRTYGNSLQAARDGRLEVKVADGGPLKLTRRGLELDSMALGDKNLAQMNHMNDLGSTATLADVISKFNSLLDELRRTKRLRGGV